MERVCGRSCHRLPARRALSDLPSVTPDYVREWGSRAHGSPLYRRLCEVVASDAELLGVINRIEHQPPPNMLFAAVQFLLTRTPTAPLHQFYPNFTDEPGPVREVDTAFKDFVLANEEEIVRIGRTRYTQTNECRRCVALLPGVWFTGLERFHLVEIGASAGLNLAMDRYRYRWGEVEWGPDSSVVLEAQTRGGRVEPRGIEIASRTGLDLNPVDPADPDERDWLVALIWPEQEERRVRLEEALSLAATVPMDLIAGSALETLPAVLGGLPPGEPAVVVNSMALIQFNRPEREELYRLIEEGRRERPVHRVSFEFLAAGDQWVTLAADRGAGLAQIGRSHPHGEWVELYARP